MMYRILGELSIGPETEPLELPTGRALTVLALLLFNARRRVSRKDLLRMAWGGAMVGETQLHKSVSNLRALLATVGRRDDLVTHTRFGYELRVDAEDVDKLMFEQYILAADVAREEGRVDDEVDGLRRGLRLWRGEHVLSGVPGLDPGFGAGLRQRRKRATVRLAELEMSVDRHADVLDDLQTMIRYHPADRRLCELLMLALGRSGQGTEAVAVHDSYAQALREQTGAEVDRGLRDLMYAIASGDAKAVAGHDRAVRRHSPVAPAAVPRQLPIATRDFVGRGDEVLTARHLLTGESRQAPPVVVVTGAGGIGKTALAVHVAHQVHQHFPDGQLYLEMVGTGADPLPTEEALARILRAFEVVDIPDSRQDRTALVRTLLGSRRVLLLLDDARDEAQVRDLLPGNPTCGVLVTSRSRLTDLPGAHQLTVVELTTAEAVDLFERCVRNAGEDPTTEPEATRRVVRLCAGLPLAISIAGALRGRRDGRGTAGLAERLERQRLDALVYRERSVALSIGAGLEQLDPHAQHLFFGLGMVQLHDFDEWTAAAILAGEVTDPFETLARLAACNLVQVTERRRYRFHDLTREYAQASARLRMPDEAQRLAVAQRVYAALLSLTRRAHRGLYGGDFELVHSSTQEWDTPPEIAEVVDRAPLAWYEAERLNLRAAVRHTADLGLDEVCWDLAVSAHEFYNLYRYTDDWHATHLIALRVCRERGNPRGEAILLAILGQPALMASQRANMPGHQELVRSVELFEQLGDEHGKAIALRTLGNNLRRRGRFEDALETFGRALPGYQASEDTVGCWQTLRYTGQTYLDLHRTDEALHVLEEAESRASAIGIPRLLAQTAYWLGRTRLGLDDPAGAEREFERVLHYVPDADETGRAYATYGLGEVARRRGDQAEALACLRRAVSMSRQADDAVLEGWAYFSLAQLRHAQGCVDEAAAAYTRAAECFNGANATHLAGQALDALAALPPPGPEQPPKPGQPPGPG